MLDILMPVLSRVLLPLFAVGMTGAGLVVVITFVKDVVEFFAGEDTTSSTGAAHQPR